jgi:hypothetical protein
VGFVVEALPDRSRNRAAIRRLARGKIRASRGILLAVILTFGLFEWLHHQTLVATATLVASLPLTWLLGKLIVAVAMRSMPALFHGPVTYAINEKGINGIPWTSFNVAYDLPGQVALPIEDAFVSLPTPGLTGDQAWELWSWLARAGVRVRN